MNRTPQEAAPTTRPVDVATMRAAVDRLLDPDAVPEALPPAADEIATLTLQLRGHIELLAPEVEQAAMRLKPGRRRWSVLECVWEARSRLEAEPSSRTGGAVGHARRLARVLDALCDHNEQLGVDGETRKQAAFRRLGDHQLRCATCRAVDDTGANLNLPCPEGDRLHDEYRRARRAGAGAAFPPRAGGEHDETHHEENPMREMICRMAGGGGGGQGGDGLPGEPWPGPQDPPPPDGGPKAIG
ncbi:DUF6415 family natural product biosynthesis protein [Streptomyces curacoi]|uniref:Uncharacterized protein n=1 Tax=Streptomyces curacoi TaxID=146536 RepID=A0A117PGI2_9ACTN|nr:DUF6415 family natural product biosynthesis protein [Streptomyces curacoi]KUM79271.1 hypothetical protein AQI70_10580 [Streptomyces curacoi]